MLIIALEIILLGIGILFVHTSLLLDDGATFTLLLFLVERNQQYISDFIAYYPNRNTQDNFFKNTLHYEVTQILFLIVNGI
jgi:hypothetical protein